MKNNIYIYIYLFSSKISFSKSTIKFRVRINIFFYQAIFICHIGADIEWAIYNKESTWYSMNICYIKDIKKNAKNVMYCHYKCSTTNKKLIIITYMLSIFEVY